MQPALAEVVQNLTVPGSAAVAIAFRGATMSIPGWAQPCARASPKSSRNDAGPTRGKTSRGTAPLVPADPTPARLAARPTATASNTPRAVVRRSTTGPSFALEGADPSRCGRDPPQRVD